MKKLFLTVITLLTFNFVYSADTLNIQLEQAIKLALEQNLSVKQAELDMLIQKKSYDDAYSSFYPSFSFSTRVTKYPDKSESGGIVIREDMTHSTGFSASWSIWAGGAKFANVKMQSAYLDLYENSKTITEESITFAVVNAFLELIKSKKSMNISEDNLKLAKENLELSKTLQEIGSAAKDDVLRAEVEVSKAESGMISAENRVENAYANFCDLLNIDKMPVKPVEPDFAEFAYPVSEKVKEEALKSPYIKSSQAGVNAAAAEKKLAAADFLPNISLFANYNWSGNDYEFGEPDYSGGVAVSIDLFSGFSKFHSFEKSKLKLKNQNLSLQSKKREILTSIENDLRNLKTAQASWESAKKTLQLSQESFNLTQAKYRTGMATSLELFSAQNELNYAKIGEITSYYAIYESLAALLADMGVLKEKIMNGEFVK